MPPSLASSSSSSSTSQVQVKSEQNVMERLALEFSSLPDREMMPEGSDSAAGQQQQLAAPGCKSSQANANAMPRFETAVSYSVFCITMKLNKIKKQHLVRPSLLLLQTHLRIISSQRLSAQPCQTSTSQSERPKSLIEARITTNRVSDWGNKKTQSIAGVPFPVSFLFLFFNFSLHFLHLLFCWVPTARRRRN